MHSTEASAQSVLSLLSSRFEVSNFDDPYQLPLQESILVIIGMTFPALTSGGGSIPFS